jgi:hypothetical protein
MSPGPATNMHNTTSELPIHEKEAFVLCALPAMAQHTLRFLCSVVGVSDSKTGRHYGAMQRLENVPQDLRQHQFAIDYDPAGMVNETGVTEDLVDPHGLSGSPVWRIGVSGRSSRAWSPSDSLLVGVLTHWRPDEKVLVATSAKKLPPEW